MEHLNQTEVRRLPTRTLVLHHEVVIERPVREVWPQLFRYNDWNPQHIGAKVERIAGERDCEGEIILESKRSADGYLPPVVIEIVRIIPFKKLVWKMYKPEETPEVTFVDFTLEDIGGRTQFVYNSYGEILKERFQDLPAVGEYDAILAGIFEALKEYAEGRQ